MNGVQQERTGRAVAAFLAAEKANLQTADLSGRMVRIPARAASDVMITADLHGHRENFKSIVKSADLAANPRRHLVLQEVCHGGPQYDPSPACRSHEMLHAVARLKAAHPDRVHFILSNHELAEATNYPIQKMGRMLNLTFLMGLQQAYGPGALEVHQACRRFIASCPLAIVLPGGIWITHSTPPEVDRLGFDLSVFDKGYTEKHVREDGDVFRLVWGRDYREENVEAFRRLTGAEMFINGHTPAPNGFNTPNGRQIILDCCGSPACFVTLETTEKYAFDDVVGRIRRLSGELAAPSSPATRPSASVSDASDEDRFLLGMLDADDGRPWRERPLARWWLAARKGVETFPAFLERFAVSQAEAAARGRGFTKSDLVGGLFDPGALGRLRGALLDLAAGGGGRGPHASPPAAVTEEDRFLLGSLEPSGTAIAQWWGRRRKGGETLAAFLERRALSAEEAAAGRPGYTRTELVGGLFDSAALARLRAAVHRLAAADHA